MVVTLRRISGNTWLFEFWPANWLYLPTFVLVFPVNPRKFLTLSTMVFFPIFCNHPRNCPKHVGSHLSFFFFSFWYCISLYCAFRCILANTGFECNATASLVSVLERTDFQWQQDWITDSKRLSMYWFMFTWSWQINTKFAIYRKSK